MNRNKLSPRNAHSDSRQKRVAVVIVLKSLSMIYPLAQSSTIILVVIVNPSLRIFQLVFVAALRCQVQEIVGAVEQINPPRIGGVRVKHRATGVLVERARPFSLRIT